MTILRSLPALALAILVSGGSLDAQVVAYVGATVWDATGSAPIRDATMIVEEGRIVLRNGAVTRDLLYVDDCIDAVLKLVVNPNATNTVFNIGSGSTISIAEIARTAVGISGRQNVEIIDHEENIDYSPTAIAANTGKVRSTIDWQPKTELADGLRRMWESDIMAMNRLNQSTETNSQT